MSKNRPLVAAQIDTSDIPETNEEWFRKATWRGLIRDEPDGGPDPLRQLEPKL